MDNTPLWQSQNLPHWGIILWVINDTGTWVLTEVKRKI